MKDLIIVVADSYQEKVIEALFPRIPLSSGTRPFSYDIIRNITNDAGSYNTSHDLLRPFCTEFHHAIVMFDFEGCGAEFTDTRIEIEDRVERLLSINGWDDRAAAIVINPEIENWMWVDNVNVEIALGWESQKSLYDWGRESGYIAHGDFKPIRPKETLHTALKATGTSLSSAIYKKIAQTVSYRGCQDPAFNKLIQVLLEWFPRV